VPNRPELMLRLTHTLAGLPVDQPLPLRMCQAFVQIVAATGGAITLGYATSERTLLCATDDASARYEDAQDFLREGPSLDAFRTGAVVASLSVEDQRHRWPGLASSVAAPWRSVRAIPIHPDSTVMGVLTVHDGSGMADDDDGQLTFLVNAIGAAIVGDFPNHDDESPLWTERDRVSQATGMVIAQLGIGPADALALLRAHAFAHEASVVEVSRRVVERKLDFSQPDRGEPS
jgi:ANTAR domain-containing protein/GAF domain-containing protein